MIVLFFLYRLYFSFKTGKLKKINNNSIFFTKQSSYLAEIHLKQLNLIELSLNQFVHSVIGVLEKQIKKFRNNNYICID